MYRQIVECREDQVYFQHTSLGQSDMIKMRQCIWNCKRKLQYNSSWGLQTCEWTGILSHSFHKTSWTTFPGGRVYGCSWASQISEAVNWEGSKESQKPLDNNNKRSEDPSKGLILPTSFLADLTYSERDPWLPQRSQTVCSIRYLCQGLQSSLLGTHFIKGTIFYPGYERKHVSTYEDLRKKLKNISILPEV